MLYLDHAASAPLSQAALDAMHPWLTGGLGNPASVHAAGRQMADALEAARALVAEVLSTDGSAETQGRAGEHDAGDFGGGTTGTATSTFRVRAEEIMFTSGGSEANAAAVMGMARAARDRDPRRTRLLVSAVEHSSVLAPAAQLAEREGFELVTLPVDREGAVDLAVLARELGLPGAGGSLPPGPGPGGTGNDHGGEGDETTALPSPGPALPPTGSSSPARTCALVAVQAVNNEVGTIQPLAEVAALAHAAGARLLTDAVAAVGATDLEELARLADALTLSAHKFGGPQGAGVLRLAPGTPFVPLMPGAQESGRRAGTPGVANALGTAAALQDALGQAVRTQAAELQESRGGTAHAEPDERRSPRAQSEHGPLCEQHRLRERLEATVLAAAGGRARATGPSDPARRSPHIASFAFPGLGGETLLMELEERGVLCSSGSACHAGSTEPSHVLLAMGLSPDAARSAVRMSFGPDLTDADLPAVAEAVSGAVRAVAGLGAEVGAGR
ncbi:cysteine desulfurase family protein [Brevibacterium album]|uniref:cysteine desulfurase family protein n=1 Tax=Brevibacterium album TaxID=417948 RepID=UPI000411D82B|nr:aminotransferase class V-fold PLP-dependent enzyme [Brevibacterium album]